MVGVGARKTQFPGDPEMVRVDDQGPHPERTEVQGRCTHLAADTGKPLEPGKGIVDGHRAEEIEFELSPPGGDGTQRGLQQGCLALGEVDRRDRGPDLATGSVPYRFPGPEPPSHGGEGRQRLLTPCPTAHHANHQLIHRLEMTPRSRPTEAGKQARMHGFQGERLIVDR